MIVDLLRVQGIGHVAPMIGGRIQIQTAHAVDDGAVVAVVVPVDTQDDTAGLTAVGGADDFPHRVTVADAVRPLDTLVTAQDAGIRGLGDGLLQPGKLFLRDLAQMMVPQSGLGCGSVMSQHPLHLGVIGVQDNKAVAVTVKVVVTSLQAVHIQNVIQVLLVGVMVAENVVGGQGEIGVGICQGAVLGGGMEEVAQLNNKGRLRVYGALQDGVQECGGVVGEDLGFVVQIGQG